MYDWRYGKIGDGKLNFNRVQTAAFALIQTDARFIYTLTDIHQNAQNINSNYIAMCQPYIGIFADGAEQWCRKLNLQAPVFNKEEKIYYTALRQGHKLFEKTYDEHETLLLDKFQESDDYFYSVRSNLEKLLGYYNVGTDYCNDKFCGNTIICAMYIPQIVSENKTEKISIRDISIVAGKLAAYFGCKKFPPYRYDDSISVGYKDYHFYKNCPLKLKTNLGFVLFSILCSINYVIEFIDKYFVEEISLKFKFAYLQYYYLCDFLAKLNIRNGTSYYIDSSLQNREFRNCLAHYGLGQFLKESEIIDDDIIKGLTYKAFDMDYHSSKQLLYKYLGNLSEQIEADIF